MIITYSKYFTPTSFDSCPNFVSIGEDLEIASKFLQKCFCINVSLLSL